MNPKIADLANALMEWKVKNPDIYKDEGYGSSRHSYCTLVLLPKGELGEQLKDWDKRTYKSNKVLFHKFEVRGFNITPGLIEVAVVNWTALAGTGTLRLTEDNVDQFKILENEPTLQVLFD